MLWRRCSKKHRKWWLVVVLITISITCLLWTSAQSSYRCLEEQETRYPTRYQTEQMPSPAADSWGEAVLLGGHPRSEKVFVTIGVPTVRRHNGSYLFSTLQSLINESTETERQNTTVVISVNDRDANFTSELMKELRSRFNSHLQSGFVVVITAPETYYPSLERLRATFGDDENRVRWRSKQNLDYAFLIHYSQNISQYYLQLEDDNTAAPGYVTKMTSYIHGQTEPWTMLDFSEHGFIGKLYKSSSLPKLANLLRTFFNEQPCDFLLLHFLNLMLQRKRYIRIPTLFKHIGYYSSLQNTTRKHASVYFEDQTKQYKGDNPPALLQTTIKDFDNNKIERAYNSSQKHAFFWGKTPQAGDWISIIFNTPHNVTRIVVASGLATDHERDRIHSAILEYARSSSSLSESPTCNADIKLGFFDKAEFDYKEETLLNVTCLKITITENYSQWLVIKEIAVFVKK